MTNPDLSPPPTCLPGNASLFIDFDGTLVELVDRPEEVVVDPGLVSLLSDLVTAFSGRIAIVSGRSVVQLEGFLGSISDTVILVGSHGAERRFADGRIERFGRPAGLDAATAALNAFATLHPGIIVERKSLGVALHYRMVPELAADAQAFAREVAAEHDLEPQPGKMMMDLKPPGETKGTGLHHVMREPGLAYSLPWFVGDDLTDEAAFSAAAELDGCGVIVGARRPTLANFALADVSAVRRWLSRILENRS